MGSCDDIPSRVTNGKPAIPKAVPLRKGHQDRLVELYSENVVAKVLRAAFDQLVANVSIQRESPVHEEPSPLTTGQTVSPDTVSRDRPSVWTEQGAISVT